MATQAIDLGSVSDALAVGAAILRFFRGWAGAGRIRAFLGAGHNPPLAVRLLPSDSGTYKIAMPKPTQR